MKKFLAGPMAALMMAAGVVAVSNTPAVAAPYPGTVDTYCHAHEVGRTFDNEGVKVYLNVSIDGNGHPSGRAIFLFDKRHSNKSYKFTDGYGGGHQKFRLGELRRGKYDVTVKFHSRPRDSVYKNCSDSFTMRVRKSKG